MQKNKPDHYNDLDKVYSKIWNLLSSGLKNRDAPFHIPVFISGNKENRFMVKRITLFYSGNPKYMLQSLNLQPVKHQFLV